jgi:hypothetical protein
MRDPIARETNGMLDAIKSRIPGVRETLLPKRDVFGEPEANKDRAGRRAADHEEDRERRQGAHRSRAPGHQRGRRAEEGARGPRHRQGSGEVKLEPEQRDIFADVGGHLAHEILAPIVNSPQWDALPPLVQKRAYAKAFMAAHKQARPRRGAAGAARNALLPEITQKIAAELVPAQAGSSSLAPTPPRLSPARSPRPSPET